MFERFIEAKKSDLWRGHQRDFPVHINTENIAWIIDHGDGGCQITFVGGEKLTLAESWKSVAQRGDEALRS
jgi:hypothetical protein